MEAEIDAVFRAEHARAFASLVRHFGDWSRAEDALQDAYVAAVETWPARGIPDKPAAWIVTTARNAATSAVRRDRLGRDKVARLAADLGEQAAADEIPDDRLRLLFLCCHPALSDDARVALTLRAMCGVSTVAIARLFYSDPVAIGQRLVRAQRKMKAANIPFAMPREDAIEERTDAVLHVIYLLFTEGHTTTDGEVVAREELCVEAIHLGNVLSSLLPTHAEARGLLALMVLHHARAAARVDADGETVALFDQDRARWDRELIAEGVRHLDEALARGPVGPYQIEAAIAALHAQAPSETETDWAQIEALYEKLVTRAPSPAAFVSLSFATGMARGPEAGLDALARHEVAGELAKYALLDAARAELLRRAGRFEEARAAYERAIARARNERERRYFERRLRA